MCKMTEVNIIWLWCTFQNAVDLSSDNFTASSASLPVIKTADVQKNLDYFAPWLQADNKQPFILVGPEGCGKE